MVEVEIKDCIISRRHQERDLTLGTLVGCHTKVVVITWLYLSDIGAG